MIVSRTLNTKTDEIEKIRKALGDRHAATFDGVPQHTTREAVVQIAKHAKDSGGRPDRRDRRRLGGRCGQDRVDVHGARDL